MKLRPYEKKDSGVICSWLSDEAALYKWSADRIGRFPLEGDELNREYYEKTYKMNFSYDPEEKLIKMILLGEAKRREKPQRDHGYDYQQPKSRIQ